MALDGMVHLTHPDTGGEFLCPDDADVIGMWAARGWVRSDAIPEHLDPDAPNTGAVPTLAGPADLVDEPATEPAVEAVAGDAAPTTTEAAVAEVNTEKEKKRA